MLRKAVSYSKHYKLAYTRRSTVRSKNYVKAIPGSKVTKFVMGDIRKFNEGKFPVKISLVSNENSNIRDNAIESARMSVNRHLDETFKGAYYFIVSMYPHHILRENKMLTGAGADRMQTGMTMSFGVPIGIAAQVKSGKALFTVAITNKQDIPKVRIILRRAGSK